MDHYTGNRVAIKQIKDVFGVFENAKRIYREVKLLRALDHVNIVKIVHIQKPKYVLGRTQCVCLQLCARPTVVLYPVAALLRNPRLFNDLYIVFECMDLDLNKLGRDVKQSLTLEHVRWFMYQVRGVGCRGCRSQKNAYELPCTRERGCRVVTLAVPLYCGPGAFATVAEVPQVHPLGGYHSPRHQARQRPVVRGV